jgi:hypothetical protein
LSWALPGVSETAALKEQTYVHALNPKENNQRKTIYNNNGNKEFHNNIPFMETNYKQDNVI